ncbi:unnamed protein product, partial [Medioppia subpectinata]
MFANNTTKRKDLFITSKVWSTFHKRSAVVEALKLSLNNLGLDYLDLALIHWPIALKSGTGYLWPLDENNMTLDEDISVVETWKGMEDAYRLGLAKSIGVSNFNSEQLSRVLKHSFIKPVVNQFETHPYLSQEKLVQFCHNNSIQVIAYCPIGKADKGLLNEPILTTIAAKNNKTVPQLAHSERHYLQIPSVNLVDGHKIPTIGLGTYDLTNQQEVMDRILNDAYDLGYRHIDTAYVYQNEELIGRSLAKMFAANKTRREDLFITSKVWNVFHKRSQVVEAMKLSLNMLGVDYLDLSLVHWPLAFRSGTGFLRPLDE